MLIKIFKFNVLLYVYRPTNIVIVGRTIDEQVNKL